MSCRPSVISYDVTLRGGLSAGQFTPIGHVDGMEACVNLCCKRKTCDVALMLRDSCYSITCASEELCEEVPAPSTDFYPRLSYVRRDLESQTKKGERCLTLCRSAFFGFFPSIGLLVAGSIQYVRGLFTLLSPTAHS